MFDVVASQLRVAIKAFTTSRAKSNRGVGSAMIHIRASDFVHGTPSVESIVTREFIEFSKTFHAKSTTMIVSKKSP